MGPRLGANVDRTTETKVIDRVLPAAACIELSILGQPLVRVRGLQVALGLHVAVIERQVELEGAGPGPLRGF